MAVGLLQILSQLGLEREMRVVIVVVAVYS